METCILAAIWNDIDILRKKDVDLRPINTYLCDICNIPKIYQTGSLPVCTQCGMVDTFHINESAEWTSGIGEDGKVNDPSRCAAPANNPQLFSDSWGKGTIISTNSSTYETKRMAKINFHHSMNHKDRSLYHAYQNIDEACQSLPDVILVEAKTMYKKFNEGKLTRGAVRAGIKANCVLAACKKHNVPRTTKEIADMFAIQSKDVSRTSQMFSETIQDSNEKNINTKPFDVVNRLLGQFEISKSQRMECIKICTKLEKCVELMSKTPTSVATAVIYLVMSNEYSKASVCEKCSVSVPTLNKILVIVKRYLEV